jgi:hypothetical protein
MKSDDADPLLSEGQAAHFLGDVSLSWLQKGRCQGYGPPFIRLRAKGAIRYRLSDLQAFLERHTVRPDSHCRPEAPSVRR